MCCIHLYYLFVYKRKHNLQVNLDECIYKTAKKQMIRYLGYDIFKNDDEYNTGFKFVKQNWLAKISECREEGKRPTGGKNVLDLQIILWKMRRVLTKFCKETWLSFANESLSLPFFNKIMSREF